MIAPSPDWFVGVRNVDLYAGGNWVDRLEFDLTLVYDAGTDAGMTFTGGGSDLTPHIPIRLVADEGNHFLGNPMPIGRIVIERVPKVHAETAARQRPVARQYFPRQPGAFHPDAQFMCGLAAQLPAKDR